MSLFGNQSQSAKLSELQAELAKTKQRLEETQHLLAVERKRNESHEAALHQKHQWGPGSVMVADDLHPHSVQWESYKYTAQGTGYGAPAALGSGADSPVAKELVEVYGDGVKQLYISPLDRPTDPLPQAELIEIQQLPYKGKAVRVVLYRHGKPPLAIKTRSSETWQDPTTLSIYIKVEVTQEDLFQLDNH